MDFGTNDITDGYIEYDLGQAYTIDRLALWSISFNPSQLAITAFNLAGDAVFLGTFNPVPPSVNPTLAEVISFGPVNAQIFRFDSFSTPTGRLGIGEVAFGGTPIPEPTTMLLFGTGLVVLAGARRKMKK